MSEKRVKKGSEKTFYLVHPEIAGGKNAPMATSDDKYQAARKLASEAYRQYFKATGEKVFDIVIKEKLTRESKKNYAAKQIAPSDRVFFSAYHVKIDDSSPSSYNKDGKQLKSGFKPIIESRNGTKATPQSEQLVMKYVDRASPSTAV